MSIVLALAAFGWFWVASGPFLSTSYRWYRAARVAGAAPPFTTAFDRVARGDLRAAFRLLGPYAWDGRHVAGHSFSSRWVATLALMVAMWLVGLPVILVGGPGLLEGAIGIDAFGILIMMLGFTTSASLVAYAVWRRLGPGAVARVLFGAGLFAVLALVTSGRLTASDSSMLACSTPLPGELFILLVAAFVAAGWVSQFAPPSAFRTAARTCLWVYPLLLLLGLGSGCIGPGR